MVMKADLPPEIRVIRHTVHANAQKYSNQPGLRAATRDRKVTPGEHGPCDGSMHTAHGTTTRNVFLRVHTVSFTSLRAACEA
jgi:hypothetical protein